MNRLGTLAMISVSSLFVGVALLVGDGIGYAQQRSDSDNVNAAVNAFHAALSNLDIGKMQNVWAQEPYVVLINPRDNAPAIGWDAVKKDWQDRVFGFWAELKLSPKQGPHIPSTKGRRGRLALWASKAKTRAVRLSALPSSRRKFTKSAAIAGSWFSTTHPGCQNKRRRRGDRMSCHAQLAHRVDETAVFDATGIFRWSF